MRMLALALLMATAITGYSQPKDHPGTIAPAETKSLNATIAILIDVDLNLSKTIKKRYSLQEKINSLKTVIAAENTMKALESELDRVNKEIINSEFETIAKLLPAGNQIMTLPEDRKTAENPKGDETLEQHVKTYNRDTLSLDETYRRLVTKLAVIHRNKKLISEAGELLTTPEDKQKNVQDLKDLDKEMNEITSAIEQRQRTILRYRLEELNPRHRDQRRPPTSVVPNAEPAPKVPPERPMVQKD